MFLWILFIGALRIMQANFSKQTSSYMTTSKNLFQYGAFFDFAAAVFCFIYLFFSGWHGFSTVTVVCSALAACSYVTEQITSLESLKRAPLVLCNMCTMGGGIILTSIVGIFFFQEPMSIVQWLGVAVFFAAAFCLSPGTKESDSSEVKKMTWKTFGILAANFILNGTASTISKYYAVRVGNGNIAMYSVITYLFSSILFLFLLFMLILRRRSKAVPVQSEAEVLVSGEGAFPKKLLLYGTLLGASCASVTYWNTWLAKSIPVVILNTVPSAISIIGCLFIGALFFKEKITVKNVIGVVLGILSVVMIVC